MTLLPMDGGLGGPPRMFGGRRWVDPDTNMPAFDPSMAPAGETDDLGNPSAAPALPLQGPFAVTGGAPGTPQMPTPRPGMFGRRPGSYNSPADPSPVPAADGSGAGANTAIDPRLMALVGQEPKRNKGSFGDVLAAILAVGADAFNPQANGRARASEHLAEQWQKRRDAYDQALSSFQNRQRMATMPGMTEREMEAYLADPKAWGSNMSNAIASRYNAATLNPGDTRVYGDPSIGGNTYQALTRGQQYAESLGLTPGSEAWNNAVRDQELGANGPTGFANSQTLQNDRQTHAEQMERLRQRDRLTLNGVQQAGRARIHGQPTYRDTHPLRPRIGGSAGGKPHGRSGPTATGPNGEKIYYDAVQGKWINQNGRPVG